MAPFSSHESPVASAMTYRRSRHDPDVRRLILEIQRGRCAFSELAALAGEIYWDVSKDHASLEDTRRAFARLRHRLRRELDRIGQRLSKI